MWVQILNFSLSSPVTSASRPGLTRQECGLYLLGALRSHCNSPGTVLGQHRGRGSCSGCHCCWVVEIWATFLSSCSSRASAWRQAVCTEAYWLPSSPLTPQPQLLPVLRDSPSWCSWLYMASSCPSCCPLLQPPTALVCILLSSHRHVLPNPFTFCPQHCSFPPHSRFPTPPPFFLSHGTRAPVISELDRNELGKDTQLDRKKP